MKRLFRKLFVLNKVSWHVNFISDLSRILNVNNYAEIGIYEGETFLKVFAAHKFAIDISESALTFVPNTKNVTKICGTSEDFAFLLKDKTVKLDLIFIDANHAYREVVKDFSNLLPYLSNKAVVLLHDTYPGSIEYLDPTLCGDAYLSISVLSQLYKDWSFITIPVHPGLSIATRIPLYPEWLN